jgi:hypothetical protein
MGRVPAQSRTRSTLRLNDADRELLRRLLENTEASQSAQDAKPPVDVDVSPWRDLPLWGVITRLGKILTFIGVIGALVSLWMVVEANRVSRDALRATAVSSGTNALLQFDTLLAQQDKDGRMLARFVEGESQLTRTKAQAKFTEVAIAQLDLLDGYRALVVLQGVADYFDRPAFERWRDWTFRRSPGLCRVLDAVQQTYPYEFVKSAVAPCGAELTLRVKP